MKQKLAFVAVPSFHKPKVLFLDAGTTKLVLDPVSRKRILGDA